MLQSPRFKVFAKARTRLWLCLRSLCHLQQRERERTDKGERLAIRLSNIANVLLFCLKVYASIASRSLAIIASTLDSLLDMLSGFILWYTARSMRLVNPYKYPIGKKRMQPLVGNKWKQLRKL